MSPDMWNHGLELFAGHGFSEPDAAAWLAVLDARGAIPDRRHPVEAREYLEAGFTLETAATWWAEKFPATHAGVYLDAGWTAEDMVWLYQLALDAPHPMGKQPRIFHTPPRPILDWLDLGLHAARVLRLLAAGVAPAEAPAWADCDDGTLDTIAALRHPGRYWK